MDRDPRGYVQAQIRMAQNEQRSGNLAAAEARIDQLNARFPGRADVLVAKGTLLVAGGKQQVALECFQSALKVEPDLPEALDWTSFVCLNLKQTEKAERFARRLVELTPSNARAHFLLGSALLALSKPVEAMVEVDRTLELKPGDVDSLVLKAQVLQAQQMPAQATELYRQAMAIRPNPVAGMELARVLMRDNHYEKALEVFNQIAPSMPTSDRPYGPMAQAYTLLHRFGEADEQWSLARKQSGNPVEVSQSRAVVEIAAGRFEVAQRLLLELIDRGQDIPGSFSILSTSKKMTAEDLPLIRRVASLLKDLSISQRIDINYALGKSFDDLRDYERAMSHYDEANRICYSLYREERAYDQDRRRAYTDFLIEATSPSKLGTLDEESSLPLFVVGMFRSGTTLTEGILSAHSKVKGTGEQAFWTERQGEFIDPQAGQLNTEAIARFAKEYLRLIDPEDEAIRHSVDKNPGNIDFAGILHTAYPNAKTIHLKRHPVDNLLSIWMTPLNAFVKYASSRPNLVFEYREYMRLWKHWEQVLPPDRFKTVRYEDLTSQPRETIGEMLDYLDLEPEEACFAPETNKRSVLTPSVYQVRQPIHRGSQARWKSYEPWLGEFAELLNEE